MVNPLDVASGVNAITAEPTTPVAVIADAPAVGVRFRAPAEKPPLASRDTMAPGVSRLVAVVAVFATLPELVIVASLLSAIAALGEISALTINDDDKLPNASLCTTPAPVNPAIDTVPPDDIAMLGDPAVLKVKLFADAERPVVGLPEKFNEGFAADPAGTVRLPVMVPPEIGSLLLSCACIKEVVSDR